MIIFDDKYDKKSIESARFKAFHGRSEKAASAARYFRSPYTAIAGNISAERIM